MGGFISLADAKLQVKAETDAEDALIQAFIDAAGAHVEQITGWVSPKRTGETLTFDRFPSAHHHHHHAPTLLGRHHRGAAFELPLRPVDPDSVAIAYIDTAGAAQTFTDFRVFTRNGLTRIGPAFGVCWPATACLEGAVTLTFDVGFTGSTDTVTDTDSPANIRHAVRLLAGDWFAKRQANAVDVRGTPAEIPHRVTDLLAFERLVRV